MTETFDRDFFVKAGKKGGNTTKDKFTKLDADYYKKIRSKRKKVAKKKNGDR